MCWLSKWILLFCFIDCKFMNHSLFSYYYWMFFTQYFITNILWMSHVLLDLVLLINKNKRQKPTNNCHEFGCGRSTHFQRLFWSYCDHHWEYNLNLLLFPSCKQTTNIFVLRCMVSMKVESFHKIYKVMWES